MQNLTQQQPLFSFSNNQKNIDDNDEVLSASLVLRQPFAQNAPASSQFKRKTVILQQSRPSSLSGRGSELFRFLGEQGSSTDLDFTAMHSRKTAQNGLYQEQSKSLAQPTDQQMMDDN